MIEILRNKRIRDIIFEEHDSQPYPTNITRYLESNGYKLFCIAKKFSGIARKLPPLFAGNPVNYSKLNKLTTVEALSGALFILGYFDDAMNLLEKFKWGHTFYDLNKNYRLYIFIE